MPKTNDQMRKAKAEKNDEFYTMYEDIEKELIYYKDILKDKIIYMPCDNPEQSNFWKYFTNNFNEFQLKKIMCTHLELGKNSYALSFDGKEYYKEELIFDGDFRSTETNKYFYECDIVITNPPFSLFREFISKLESFNKKYLVIGNKNALANRDIFPLIKSNKLWVGCTSPKEFILPGGEATMKVSGLCVWFTNLDIAKRHKDIALTKKYNEQDYPKYDNCDAINIDKVNDIPCDYYEMMGVPVTFLNKYNPEQFEIIGLFEGEDFIRIGGQGVSEKFVEDYINSGGKGVVVQGWKHAVYYKDDKPVVPYWRIFVKRKNHP